MLIDEEKDYLMRMIKEIARILFSVMLGKKYVQVELPEENKFEVSGRSLGEFKAMIDRGEINEAENMLLEDIDYSDQDDVAAATFFYRYLSEKDEDFLQKNNYSLEEVLDGLKQLANHSGCGELCDMVE